MLYRWGFIDNGVFTECKPIVDDDAAIDFAPQTNEVFYRAKLNGGLSFRFEFDAILARGYNYEHIVVLQYFNESLNDWGEVWRGRFTLTDCEINYDTRTINVTPETLDRYTKVLDHLEDEYNLVKLAAQQQPVGIIIRPLYQFYSLNDSKLVNLIGGNSWEVSCDTTGATEIETEYHFRMVAENLAFWLKFDNTVPNPDLWGKTILMSGTPDYSGTPRVFNMIGRYWDGSQSQTLTLRCAIVLYSDETHFALYWPSGGGWEVNPFVVAVFERDEAGTAAAITISSYLADANAQWDKIYCRMLLNYEGDTYHGEPLYDLAANDMAGANMNYTKISRIAPVGIQFNQYTQTAPTEWGLSYNDEYFLKPAGQIFPIGQGLWKYVSVWGSLLVPYTIFDDANKEVTIRDCYKLPTVILRLFEKAGVVPDYFISRVLLGSNDYVGDPFYLCITPRSNVISSYYDTPAQNAPITLAKVLNMLKAAYQIYWHIDGNGNLHFEHISYYDNGYSYSEDEPQLLVDLETEQHTRTTESKCFGQNRVKYDKQDMPAQLKFSWADVQTPPFDGYAIKMLDKYVQQGTTDEKMVGDFDSDVDYVLASPSDVTKDGLFLFACPSDGENISWTLDLQDFTIKDETGFEYEVRVQNADASFWKIHQSFWRYKLPCENIEVNNTETTAITTGRFKLQSVEFADVAMAGVIADIDECAKVVRTQQGDGHIKSLSINLNSLAAKADLLFNFVGRYYYLRGTALGASIVINVDNEPITIEVSDNKWKLKYSEPLTALDFNGADVVSVNFADCDRLENLTTADGMFENCAELLAVDFGGKKLAAVTSAVDMFAGCAQLTTLICPASSTWKPDLSFADCPDLTTASVYSLLGFLFDYDSGVHTIDFNSTMWNALDADTQTDITTRAAAKGWTIGTAVAYYISGQSAAGTVYATINGESVEIPVSGGAFNYTYYVPITSLSFENDADVTDIDFSLSDGLAGVTSLANAFKNCAGLTTLDFTNCDLSNVASASDCFAGCVALYTLEIPTGTWQPDLDLSDTVILYSEMLNVVDGLYSYTGGVHNVTFNSTIWDAMSVADQQAVWNAADAKSWETNAVAVIYRISGKSSKINDTENFKIQFINKGSLTPSAQETITALVDSNGDWEFTYVNKNVYSFNEFAYGKTTLLSLDLTNADDMSIVTDCFRMLRGCSNLQSINFNGALFSAVTDIREMFALCSSIATISLPSATFEAAIQANSMFYQDVNLTSVTWSNNLNFASLQTMGGLNTGMFEKCSKITAIDLSGQTLPNVTNLQNFAYQCSKLKSVAMPNALLTNVTSLYQAFYYCIELETIDFQTAAFGIVTTMAEMCRDCNKLQSVRLDAATFASVTTMQNTFANCYLLSSLNISNAEFGVLTTPSGTFYRCDALTTITATKSNKAFANAATAGFNLQYSPLTYQSMLGLANLVKDRTNLTAITITFKASAWNALSSAEQSTIDGILSGKNWNRAIA